MSTELFAFADSTSISAVVFVVDEAHQDGLGTIVDVFASPDTATCLTQALQAQDTTSDTTFSPDDFAIANESRSRPRRPERLDDLDDPLRVRRHPAPTTTRQIAIAHVDRALAMTFSDWSGDTEPDSRAEDALAAVVDAL